MDFYVNNADMKTLNTWHALFYACTILFAGVYAFRLLDTKSREIAFAKDEVRYFVNTDYFELFLSRKWDDPSWQQLDAYDQPPLYKYVFALTLFDYRAKVSELRTGILAIGNRVDLEQYEDDIPKNTPVVRFLEIGRRYSVWLTMMTLGLLLFIVFAVSGNIVVSIISVVLLTQNSAFSDSMIYVKPESTYVPLLLIALIFCVYSLRRQSLVVGMFSSFVGGLAMAAKLTGFAYFILLPYCLAVFYFTHRSEWRFMTKFVLITLICGFVGWYLLNPTIYPHPILNSIKYFMVRADIMSIQASQNEVRPQLILSFSDKARSAWCTLFVYKPGICLYGNATPFPVLNIILFIGGILYLQYRAQKHNVDLAMYALVISIATIIFMAIIQPFAWYRYYIPSIIAVAIINGSGLAFLFDGVRKIWKVTSPYFVHCAQWLEA